MQQQREGAPHARGTLALHTWLGCREAIAAKLNCLGRKRETEDDNKHEKEIDNKGGGGLCEVQHLERSQHRIVAMRIICI